MQARRLFGTNGIRGVVNVELTPEYVTKIGSAIGTFFERKRIVVGYDGRTSSPMFARAMIAGLTSTGCDVYEAGMSPTPTIQYAVKHYEMDGGVIVTASHNPPEYNGVKVAADDGIELQREQEIKIENIFFKEKIKQANWKDVGRIFQLPEVLSLYNKAIEKHVNIGAIEKRHFHVVIDPGNGVGALTAPYVLRKLGCKVTTINANVDGTFPNRLSEPRPENLDELVLTVKSVKADVGVAYDGDADRAIFVDEKGEFHWGDRTFALIEKYFLQDNRGETIVTPVSSSHVIKDIADEYGGKVVWTKVGSVIVSHTMKKINAKLGGEENGGVFYAPHQAVRDGTMTTALVLDIMAKTKKKLSQLLAELPSYYIEKDKIKCPDEIKEKVVEKLLQKVKEATVDTIDGAKIWFNDKSSILIRPSGTEPIYRFYAEAKTKEKATYLLSKYKKELAKIINELKS